jgi:hypothetical protein
MLRFLATAGALSLALSGTALAQTAPAPPANPSAARAAFAARAANFALRGAYRAIADAEARGASTYLDAAKAHYRGALARLARQDAGAASEAMAAGALARASVADHPVPAPRDIPAPPALAQAPGPQMQRGGMHMHRGGPGGMGGRFDATRVAADAKLADTAEARDLAQKAVDADVARTHAAFAGNQAEAMREGREADALAMAVRALAMADHPPTFRFTPGRRPPGPRPATVGLTTPDE